MGNWVGITRDTAFDRLRISWQILWRGKICAPILTLPPKPNKLQKLAAAINYPGVGLVPGDKVPPMTSSSPTPTNSLSPITVTSPSPALDALSGTSAYYATVFVMIVLV